MQKWEVNAAEFVLIIQQLLRNERQRQKWCKSRGDLGRVPCTEQEGQRLWSSSISSLVHHVREIQPALFGALQV